MTAKELNRKLIRELHSLLPEYKISEKDAEKSPKNKVSVCIGKPGLAAEMMIYPEDYSAGIETDADIRKLAEAIADKAYMVREMSEVVTCRSLRDSDKLDAFPAFMGMDLSAVPHYRVPGTDISLITRVVLGKTEDTETSYLVTDDKLDFFGDDAAKFRYSHLAGALQFIPYGTLVDHFQHEVYAHPEMTPRERHDTWKRLMGVYMPWERLDGEIPFYADGEHWQLKHHIYSSPFYYIDYCLAQTVALEFWAMIKENRADAWDHYMAYTSLGGSKVFTELLKEAGLESPFEEETLAKVCAKARTFLEEYDLSNIH